MHGARHSTQVPTGGPKTSPRPSLITHLCGRRHLASTRIVCASADVELQPTTAPAAKMTTRKERKQQKSKSDAQKPQAGGDAAENGAGTAQEHSFTSPSPVLDIDESEYTPQLDRKLERLKELFSTLCPPGETLPAVEVFTSEPSHYRYSCASPKFKQAMPRGS